MSLTKIVFPSLKEHLLLRIITLGLLYIAQGLPIGLFQVAIPAWLASQGLSAAEVGGFIAISFLPWSFKLLAGPIMDRFSFPAMGKRRPWVLFAQFNIILALLLMAFLDPDPTGNLKLLAMLGFLVNSFGAMQDVAVDGMAIDILEDNERARANAFMFGGQVLGISIAGALGSYCLLNFGLSTAAFVMALLVSLIMIVPLCLRERSGERLLPWTQGLASAEALDAVVDNIRAIFSMLIRTVILPMSLVLIVVAAIERLGAGVLLAIAPVLLVQDLGWSQTDYSSWVSLSGIIAAVFGILICPLIDRYGARITLTLMMVLRMIMFASVALFESHWSNPSFFKVLILLDGIFGQVTTIALIALFMRISFRKIAATQFAVYMALSNLSLAMGSALIAPLEPILDYPGFFFVIAGLNGLFLLLWPFFNLDSHKAALQALRD